MKLAKFQKQIPLLILIFFWFCVSLGAQTRPIVILGGTLIDGTGRPPVSDAAIVIHEGRFREVGRRGEMSLPQGAQVIEVPGKTILPGLIDGHCHYQDGAGELYLAFGVTTCPDISKNSTDWIIAQREGIKNGTIRGPRIWASGYNLDGPPLPAMREPRRRRSGVIVRTPDEARKAVRELVDKGVDGLKFYERLTPEVAKAAAEEAHRLGKPVVGHSLDIFAAVDAGYQSVEHFWAVVYTSIQDPEKKKELDIAREQGKIQTAELNTHIEPEMLDEIIKVLVENNVHWSPTWGTWLRPLSPRADAMKQWEFALPKDPRFFAYFSPQRVRNLNRIYAMYESAKLDKRAQLVEGYRKLQDFVRRFVTAGGKIDSGSDPNRITPAYGVHVELQLLVDAGLSPLQAIQSASLNVAQTWWKDKDYGSVEKSKVADLIIVPGDPMKDISSTQDVEMVFIDGKLVGGSMYSRRQ